MGLGPLFLTFAAIAAVPPQTPHPCGWDIAEFTADTPRTVLALLHLPGSADVPADAVRDLLRWAHECDESASRAAVNQLQRAYAAHRSNPILEALYGIALARGRDVRMVGGVGLAYPPVHSISNAEKEAVRRLRHALDTQRLPVAAEELANLGLATRRAATLQESETALHLVLDASPASPLWALLSQVELVRGEQSAAIAAANNGVARGQLASRRMVGIARLVVDAAPDSAASLYLETLAGADAELLSWYFDDIRFLLTDEETDRWAALDPQVRAGWLRQAWEWRAAIATLSVPERLAIHFRRLEYALAHHRRQSTRGARPFDSLWRNPYVGLSALDDQGMVYVRHGPPDEIARLTFPGVVRDAWLYAGLAGGIALIEFVKDAMWTDYYIPDPTSIRAAQERQSQVQMGSVRDAYGTYYWRIKSFITSYAPCGKLWGCDPDQFLLQGASYRRSLARAVFESETARPRLRKPLKTLVQTYAFRAPDSSSELATLMNVLGEGITGVQSADGVSYALRFFSAADVAEVHSVVRNDTLVQLRIPGGLPDEAVIRYALSLHVEPTPTATIRISVRNQADTLQGQIVSTVRAIPEFAPHTLELSDLVIAEPRPGTWVRQGVALEPVAGNRLIAGRPFRLFYELYGVPQDEIVDVDIELAPDRPAGLLGRLAALISRREAMSLHFQEPVQLAGPDVAAVTRDITAELEPGEYTLSVKVTRRRDDSSCTASTAVVVYRAN